ncbi:restriction endonuclease subunit S [Limnovirga soli]|uniref:Restriction endonuclease subunit S n=1 Tax=Limnovirga soli TaxID=2656915 RepID=A0A8J8JU05_9BACT|nr:restriction endonuclease subunit S [Limnovirga soli]NNV55054.1 restriction endonuclease subunit S [Limnovirga soli]
MNNWKEYKFSDFVFINPTIKLKGGEKYSFVEMKDLDNIQKYCEPKVERIMTGGARFQNHDTLFARITPCLENGKICQVRNLRNNIGFGSTGFLVFRNRDGISDSDFIFYLSRWDDVRNFAEINLDGTSGRQRVSKEAFNNLYLELPPLIEQKAIAEILNSFDSKIDLLHSNNQTLQDYAETIFRQWFKEQAGTWQKGTIEDEFDFIMGQSPAGSSLNETGQGVLFFQGNADFDFRFPKARVYTTAPNRMAKKNDILVSVRAPVGDLNMAINNCYIGRGVATFRYKHNNDYYSYTFYKINSLLAPIKQFEDNGTVFGSIGKDDFKKLENVIPPKNLIEKFQRAINPIDEKF